MEQNWTEIKKLISTSMYISMFYSVIMLASIIILLVSWPWFEANVMWLAPLNGLGFILFVSWISGLMVKRIRENYEQGK